MLSLLSYYKEILKKKNYCTIKFSNLGFNIQVQSLCQKIVKELEHSRSAEMAYVVLCPRRLARLRAERRSLPTCTTAKRVERL